MPTDAPSPLPPPPPQPYVPGPGLPQQRSDGPPLAVSALVLLVVVAVEIAASTLPFYGLDAPPSEARILATFVAGPLAFVAAVLVVGRTAPRRIGAAAVAVGLVAVNLVLWFLTHHTDIVWTDEWLGRELAFVVADTGLVATAVLAVVAWGIARRRGRVWWIGVPVALLLAVLEAVLREPVSRELAHLTGQILTSTDQLDERFALNNALWAVWAMVPPLVGGLVSWLAELASPTRDQLR